MNDVKDEINELDKEELEKIESIPLSDDVIRSYLPRARILKYGELNDYKSIDELLPNVKDYVILLLESDENVGHWMALMRPNKDTVEFWDSYGGKPGSQEKWNSKNKNNQLGQYAGVLTQLLNNFDGRVVYNPVKYQGGGEDINTCGRWCILRIKQMKGGQNLDQFYNWIKRQKDNSDLSYDEIVSNYIKKS